MANPFSEDLYWLPVSYTRVHNAPKGHSRLAERQRVRGNDRSRVLGTSLRMGKTRLKLRLQHQPTWDLNRYLSIPKRLILPSRVESGMPSLAAAPAGPDIRP
jgi:hypothetical protein